MKYLAYHFTVNPPEPCSEVLIAFLAEKGFESFAQNEKGFSAYIRKDLAAAIKLGDLAAAGCEFSFSTEELPEQNWNEEWEKNFGPVRIGDKLSVRAPFHTSFEPAATDIVIMPKMSFGTGHHHTTRLMCEAMLEMEFKKKRVLDMGCGTGILAILAAKLGAADILAIDIDEWPVENARENCRNNGADNIRVLQGDVSLAEQERPFDIILANINRNVLIQHIPIYAGMLLGGGILLLSGFLSEDVPGLTHVASESGLAFRAKRLSENWALMELVRE